MHFDQFSLTQPLSRRRPMPLRYLIGPLPPGRAATYQTPRQQGRCLTFGASGDCDVSLLVEDSWPDLLARLPEGFAPDFIALELSYATVPPCLWNSPVPLVAL